MPTVNRAFGVDELRRWLESVKYVPPGDLAARLANLPEEGCLTFSASRLSAAPGGPTTRSSNARSSFKMGLSSGDVERLGSQKFMRVHRRPNARGLSGPRGTAMVHPKHADGERSEPEACGGAGSRRPSAPHQRLVRPRRHKRGGRGA